MRNKPLLAVSILLFIISLALAMFGYSSIGVYAFLCALSFAVLSITEE
jgi:hypothetical protein